MKPIEITIKQEPTAKGRARTAYRNGVVRTYTPEKTLIAQNAIVTLLQRHKRQCFAEHVPVKLTCTFYRTKSKWLKKKETMPVRKPDLDNFLKLLMDSMNGLLVVDDAQITTIQMAKRWTKELYGYIILKLEDDKDG